MSSNQLTILVVGATGSIGLHVVDEALRQGHKVRALVRDPKKLGGRAAVEIAVGDLKRPETLSSAVAGIDAVVFVHGTYGSIPNAEAVDYGGVRNILSALGRKTVRIVLMTAIAVTDRKGAHDWKRRAERLVRASGNPYIIARPGWFDCNKPNEMKLRLLQGDSRQSGTPRDGVVARSQVAAVLVHGLACEAAKRKTFELVAEAGPETTDFDRLFGTADADGQDFLDAVHDARNMPLDQEPANVLGDLREVQARKGAEGEVD